MSGSSFGRIETAQARSLRVVNIASEITLGVVEWFLLATVRFVTSFLAEWAGF